MKFRKKHIKKTTPNKNCQLIFPAIDPWVLGAMPPHSASRSAASRDVCAAWKDRVTRWWIRFLTRDSRQTPFVEKRMGNTHASKHQKWQKRIQKNKCKEGTKNMPDSWWLTMTDSWTARQELHVSLLERKMWPLIRLVHFVFSIISMQCSYSILPCSFDWDVTFFGTTCLETPNRVSLAKSDVSIVLGSAFWGYIYIHPGNSSWTRTYMMFWKRYFFSNQPNSWEYWRPCYFFWGEGDGCSKTLQSNIPYLHQKTPGLLWRWSCWSRCFHQIRLDEVFLRRL